MKKLLLLLLGLCFTTTTFAAECPFGITNDPYPGQCGRYVDQDNDGYCDLGEEETSPEPHTEEKEAEDHICDGVIRSQSITQVADFYAIAPELLQETLAEYLGKELFLSTTIGELEQAYGFKAYLANDIGLALQQGKKLKFDDVQELQKNTISGQELKKMNIKQIADYFQIETQDLSQTLKDLLKIDIQADTSFQILHDMHGLEAKKIKEIAQSLQTQTEIDTQDRTNYHSPSAFVFLRNKMFGRGLLGTILVLTLLLLTTKKLPFAQQTKIYNIGCYILIPAGLLIWTYIVARHLADPHQSFELGNLTGYLTMWLVYIILIVKPLSLILNKPQNNILKAIAAFSHYVMLWRKQLGILIFYLAFGHMLVYLMYRYTTDIALFSFFEITAFVTGLIGVIAFFVGYLTSNNRSIKKLGKRRKYVQMSAYLAVACGILHVFFINQTRAIILLILFLIYTGLRLWSVRYHKKK